MWYNQTCMFKSWTLEKGKPVRSTVFLEREVAIETGGKSHNSQSIWCYLETKVKGLRKWWGDRSGTCGRRRWMSRMGCKLLAWAIWGWKWRRQEEKQRFILDPACKLYHSKNEISDSALLLEGWAPPMARDSSAFTLLPGSTCSSTVFQDFILVSVKYITKIEAHIL